tara:strand:+ start:1313 stop:1525 length:213 start_codon:yes stop_codon:yes gene_type:complete
MKNSVKFILVLLFVSLTQSQSKIKLISNFPDAIFYKIVGNDIIKPALGSGSIVLKLKKKNLNKIKQTPSV